MRNASYDRTSDAAARTRNYIFDQLIPYIGNKRKRVDWVTEHLCPRDDVDYDVKFDRMFYMRKNGVRIDAIRRQIREWRENGIIGGKEEACLLAPLLYQACYSDLMGRDLRIPTHQDRSDTSRAYAPKRRMRR